MFESLSLHLIFPFTLSSLLFAFFPIILFLSLSLLAYFQITFPSIHFPFCLHFFITFPSFHFPSRVFPQRSFSFHFPSTHRNRLFLHQHRWSGPLVGHPQTRGTNRVPSAVPQQEGPSALGRGLTGVWAYDAHEVHGGNRAGFCAVL